MPILWTIVGAGSSEIPDLAFAQNPSLTHVMIAEGVTKIGMAAFYGCPRLEAVVIPDSVTELSDMVFLECPALTSVTLPKGLDAIPWRTFSGCISLKSVEIPESVKVIRMGAFERCTGFDCLVIPDTVTQIGSGAFDEVPCIVYHGPDESWDDWGAVRRAEAPPEVPKAQEAESLPVAEEKPDAITASGYDSGGMEWSLAEGTLIIDGIGSIWEAEWKTYRDQIRSVIFSGYCADIAGRAFSGCTALTEVDMGDEVSEISAGAFEDCTALTEIRLPQGLSYLYEDAFRGCTALTSIILPDRLWQLGDRAFADCTSLTTVVVGENLLREHNAFGPYSDRFDEADDVLNLYEVFPGCCNLRTVILPPGYENVSVVISDPFLNWEEPVTVVCASRSQWASIQRGIIPSELLSD